MGLVFHFPLSSCSVDYKSSLSLPSTVSCSNLLPDVVVTRGPHKNRKLISALAKYGISALELPLVRHTRGPDFKRLCSMLKYSAFDWIILTSPEASFVFLDAWRSIGTPFVNVGVLGKGTAKALTDISTSKQLLSLSFSPSKATGLVFASELPKSSDKRCTVLYPTSKKANTELEEVLCSRGFEVTRLNTYDTVPATVDPSAFKRAIDAPVITLASPSQAHALAHLACEPTNWLNYIVCIGETTANVVKKLGFKRVYYPTNPGIKGWVDCIVEALRIYPLFEKRGE